MNIYWRISGFFLSLIAAVFLFIIDIGNDIRDYDRGEIYQKTDIQYSIPFAIRGGYNKAAQQLRGKAEWDDLHRTRSFRKALPSLYDPQTLQPRIVIDLSAVYVIKNKILDFKENTLYLNIQLKRSQVSNIRKTTGKIAAVYAGQLKQYGIHCSALPGQAKVIKPDSGVKKAFLLLIAVKTATALIFVTFILITAGGWLLYKNNSSLKRVSAGVVIPAAGMLLMLVNIPYSLPILLFSIVCGSGLILYELKPENLPFDFKRFRRKIMLTMVLIVLTGSAGLFAARWDFFTKDHFAHTPDEDIAFYQEIKIEKTDAAVLPAKLSAYPPETLPETAFFKLAVFESFKKNPTDVEKEIALRYYNYPCQIHHSTGQIFPAGKTYFLMKSYTAPFLSSADKHLSSSQRAEKILRNKRAMNGLRTMFNRSLNRYAALTANDGYIVIPLENSGVVAPWPGTNTSIQLRALLFLVLLAAGGAVIWLR